MNALTVVFAALCIFAIGYRFYGLFIANKVLNLNDARVTPAVKYSDGHDYVDTNKYVLFGHHFAAIAAAGRGEAMKFTASRDDGMPVN